MKKISILIFDDHEVFLDGMKFILKENSEFEIDTVTTEIKFFERISKKEYGVFILDFMIPGTKVLELIDMIQNRNTNSKIIILSSMKDKRLFSALEEKKVNGYIFKSEAKDVIVGAIHTILKGESFYSDIKNVILEKFENLNQENPFSILTEKELEVVRFITRGLSNKSIAEELKISARTVEAHKRNIDMKLGKMPKAQLGKLAEQWKVR